MQPRNPDKPFLKPGNYAVLWMDPDLKHTSTEISELNKIDLVEQCEQQLTNLSSGSSYVIVLPVVNSLISTWSKP